MSREMNRLNTQKQPLAGEEMMRSNSILDIRRRISQGRSRPCSEKEADWICNAVQHIALRRPMLWPIGDTSTYDPWQEINPLVTLSREVANLSVSVITTWVPRAECLGSSRERSKETEMGIFLPNSSLNARPERDAF